MLKKLSIWMIGLFFCQSVVYAKAPEEITSSASIAGQLVDKDSISSPYLATGEALVGLLKGLIDFEDEGSSILFHRKSGKLFIKTTPKNHAVVDTVLDHLRHYDHRQVMIEARIIEVSSFEGVDIGVDWTNLNREADGGRHSVSGGMNFASGSWSTSQTLNPLNELSLAYGYVSRDNTLNVTLSALEQQGKINTLSSPNIIAFNNQRVNIRNLTSTDYVSKITTNTVYAGDSVDQQASTEVDTAVDGIVLDVTPAINSDNQSITLELHPQVIELVSLDDVDLGASGSIKTPKYVKRSADTTVVVQDGGTIVIGGLMKRTDKTDVRKVPILGDIPIIKNLFRATTTYEEKSTLIIFITAKIRDVL